MDRPEQPDGQESNRNAQASNQSIDRAEAGASIRVVDALAE